MKQLFTFDYVCLMVTLLLSFTFLSVILQFCGYLSLHEKCLILLRFLSKYIYEQVLYRKGYKKKHDVLNI